MTIKISNKGGIYLDTDLLKVVGAYVMCSWNGETKQLRIQRASSNDPTSKIFLTNLKGQLMAGCYLLKAIGFRYERGTTIHKGVVTEPGMVVVDFNGSYLELQEEEGEQTDVD